MVVGQGSVGSVLRVGSVVWVGSRRNDCSCIFLCKSATDHSFYQNNMGRATPPFKAIGFLERGLNPRYKNNFCTGEWPFAPTDF
ncbi:hypothetical protein [Okeania sp. SIO2C9]|uniref:hypothetical protein n=1 Tax=Okeania sp. SIO2C9 TaxID=2607791 RepID=UPI0025FC6991|nr:hypothetical protein [Okeania sp. SIO2C9]